VEAISRFDHIDALIYCDPPYVHQTRSKGGTEVYGVEMSDDDHRALAKELKSCKAKVLLSGYPSPLYDELYKGWRCVKFDMPNHAAGGRRKSRETECLWMNF
jgi:DNA adenine methylase